VLLFGLTEGCFVLAIVALGWTVLLAAAVDTAMDTTYLALPHASGQQVALHCIAPTKATGRGVLLIMDRVSRLSLRQQNAAS
jgi:hypothetical protein